MKKFLIPLLLMSILMTSCSDDNVAMVENLGDELLDSILLVQPDRENRIVRYSYKWDDKSRLSYMTYTNEFVSTYMWVEISYISDFITSIDYNWDFSDDWGTYTIFHDGIKVDSLYHSHGNSYALYQFEQTSHFTHLENTIREDIFRVFTSSQDTSIATSIWYLTKDGNIELKDGVEYNYDNKRNPLANSFYNYHVGVSFTVCPILQPNNITSSYLGWDGYTKSYSYLKNDLPKSASSNGSINEYHY